MPRAGRHFLPGLLGHVNHCCHEKLFLLRFPRDRRAYRRWLLEAKMRMGLWGFSVSRLFSQFWRRNWRSKRKKTMSFGL